MAEESSFGEDILSSEEELEDDEGEVNKSSSSEEEEEEMETQQLRIETNRLEYEGGESMDTLEQDSSVSDSKEAAMESVAENSPSRMVIDNEQASERDDENSKSNDDEDKVSSYCSSPPESPPASPNLVASPSSQPVSPPSPAMSPAHAQQTSNVSEIPKESIDDCEGELDFEEDTVEDGKYDNESVGDSVKKIEKASVADEKIPKSPKAEQVENVGGNAEPDDEGEVDDDDDLEEGEVKDSASNRKAPQRPMCRFFNKGQCTWGNNCRFLHPGVNDKGNYNMFATSKANANAAPNSVYTWHAAGSRQDAYFNKGYSDSVMAPPPPPPPPLHDEPHRESAWERGLRHAKEILKKSSQRKEMEPDFEEKRLNLSLSSVDVYNDYEKENDYYSRSSPYRRNSDRYSYEYEDPLLDPYERQAHEYWRGGNYENFEVRYMRSDYDYRDEIRNDRMRESDRGRLDRTRERERDVYHIERERDGRSRRDKFERQHSPERSWRDEHYPESQSQNRNRGDEWRDPWRRSTSPKRVDQRRSYSSNSSASYSSSRSSASHSSYTSASRSSSASSHSSYSSRSYSRNRMHIKQQVPHKAYGDQMPVPNRKNKIPPPAGNQQVHLAKASRSQKEKWPSTNVPPAVQLNKAASPVVVLMDKKKVKPKLSRTVEREGSLSSNASSRSSQSVSSRSSTSRSRSRGSSASSLESVSSKSSISSKSSYGSQPKAQLVAGTKRDERLLKEKRKVYDASGKIVEKMRESKAGAQLQQSVSKSISGAGKALSKDLLKQSGQKTQIKLTLLNKEKAAASAPPISTSVHRKENPPESKKPKAVEREVVAVKTTKPIVPIAQTRKRALSPTPDTFQNNPPPKILKSSQTTSASSAPLKPPSAASISSLSNKKSTSSRREELLKQLKAVEDAIARKRAKLS